MKSAKSYSLSVLPGTRSKIAAAYLPVLAPGKAGEMLVRSAFSQAAFSDFLAEYAGRLLASGKSPADLAVAFRHLGAGNASQVSQALAPDILVQFLDENGEPDGKAVPLKELWGKSSPRLSVDAVLAL